MSFKLCAKLDSVWSLRSVSIGTLPVIMPPSLSAVLLSLLNRAGENTMKYIHTVNFKEKDFEEAVATTPEEIRKLGKEGWSKYDEGTFNGKTMHFYRKPKRFGGLQ